jgi:putative tricarboxylic transport membrane protein
MSDRLLGAVCVIAAAGMAWAASDYAPPISYEPVGPRAFPLLLAGLMAIGGLWLVLRPALGRSHYAGLPLKAIAACAGAVFGYALLFELFGFSLATALMALPVGLAFGGSWRQALAGGLSLGLSLYFLFDKVLDVVLPTGILSVLLGRL